MVLEYGTEHFAIPATDLPRTEAGEKASAIQFMKWVFTPAQVHACYTPYLTHSIAGRSLHEGQVCAARYHAQALRPLKRRLY
jgi:hypothetical protein